MISDETNLESSKLNSLRPMFIGYFLFAMKYFEQWKDAELNLTMKSFYDTFIKMRSYVDDTIEWQLYLITYKPYRLLVKQNTIALLSNETEYFVCIANNGLLYLLEKQ